MFDDVEIPISELPSYLPLDVALMYATVAARTVCHGVLVFEPVISASLRAVGGLRLRASTGEHLPKQQRIVICKVTACAYGTPASTGGDAVSCVTGGSVLAYCWTLELLRLAYRNSGVHSVSSPHNGRNNPGHVLAALVHDLEQPRRLILLHAGISLLVPRNAKWKILGVTF